MWSILYLQIGRTHRLCLCSSDLTAAKVIPDVLNGVDPSHGVQMKVVYGNVTVDSKGIRLTRAETANPPTVDITDVMSNLLSTLRLQESSLYSFIIADPGELLYRTLFDICIRDFQPDCMAQHDRGCLLLGAEQVQLPACRCSVPSNAHRKGVLALAGGECSWREPVSRNGEKRMHPIPINPSCRLCHVFRNHPALLWLHGEGLEIEVASCRLWSHTLGRPLQQACTDMWYLYSCSPGTAELM